MTTNNGKRDHCPYARHTEKLEVIFHKVEPIIREPRRGAQNEINDQDKQVDIEESESTKEIGDDGIVDPPRFEPELGG